MASLNLVIGKIASGKSTLVSQLAQQSATVAMSEDKWLLQLYGEEIKSITDYVRLSSNLRDLLTPHIIELLKNGLSVVLDFQANTVQSRTWMKALALEAGSDSQFHFLDVPNEVCKARLRQRNAQGRHEFSASEEDFDRITTYFQIPQDSEGLEIVRYPWNEEEER